MLPTGATPSRLALPTGIVLILFACSPLAARAADPARLLADAAAIPVLLANPTVPASATAESLAAFPPPRVRAWQVGVLRPDRLEHAGLSFTLGAALTLAFRDRLAAAGVTVALGAGKELWDSKHGGADPLDLVADAFGLGLSLLCIRGRAP